MQDGSIRDLRHSLERLELHFIAVNDESLKKLLSDIKLATNEVESTFLTTISDSDRKSEALEKAQSVLVKVSKEVFF